MNKIVDIAPWLFLMLVCGVVAYSARTLYDQPTAEDIEQGRYCRMVRDGGWPDYQHTYQDECLAKWGPIRREFKSTWGPARKKA